MTASDVSGSDNVSDPVAVIASSLSLTDPLLPVIEIDCDEMVFSAVGSLVVPSCVEMYVSPVTVAIAASVRVLCARANVSLASSNVVALATVVSIAVFILAIALVIEASATVLVAVFTAVTTLLITPVPVVSERSRGVEALFASVAIVSRADANATSLSAPAASAAAATVFAIATIF